jgi:hypothetical protein
LDDWDAFWYQIESTPLPFLNAKFSDTWSTEWDSTWSNTEQKWSDSTPWMNLQLDGANPDSWSPNALKNLMIGDAELEQNNNTDYYQSCDYYCSQFSWDYWMNQETLSLAFEDCDCAKLYYAPQNLAAFEI